MRVWGLDFEGLLRRALPGTGRDVDPVWGSGFEVFTIDEISEEDHHDGLCGACHACRGRMG